MNNIGRCIINTNVNHSWRSSDIRAMIPKKPDAKKICRLNPMNNIGRYIINTNVNHSWRSSDIRAMIPQKTDAKKICRLHPMNNIGGYIMTTDVNHSWRSSDVRAMIPVSPSDIFRPTIALSFVACTYDVIHPRHLYLQNKNDKSWPKIRQGPKVYIMPWLIVYTDPRHNG